MMNKGPTIELRVLHLLLHSLSMNLLRSKSILLFSLTLAALATLPLPYSPYLTNSDICGDLPMNSLDCKSLDCWSKIAPLQKPVGMHYPEI